MGMQGATLRGQATAIAAVLVGCAAASGAPAPTIVGVKGPGNEIIVATVEVTPPAPGTDAAPALQETIDRVADIGGGVIFLASGRYRLGRPVTVREGVILRGEWTAPVAAVATAGTILELTAGRGEPDSPAAITLERGAGIRELTLWHPDQSFADPVPYPWAVRTSEAATGDNTTVLNATLVNPYRGICIGPEWNELHTIRNVFMTPLVTGIAVDTTTDIGRLTDVVLGPEVWEQSGLPGAPEQEAQRNALRRQLATRATALEVGRSDWEYIYRVRASGFRVGALFRPGQQGTTNAVMVGCEFRACETGLQIDALNGVGLAATGCTFEAAVGIVANPTFDTVAQFQACDFSGGNAVSLQGRGLLTFQGCTFAATASPALEARAGQLTVLGSTFTTGNGGILLGEACERARIIGNRGAEVRREAAPGTDIVVSAGPEESRFAGPDLTPSLPPPTWNPKGTGLFPVSDYGADPAREDNTEAFAQALQAAGDAGGGTVYVPAGNYRFAGSLTVPSGVELRGIFDVPHHTISAGSVLMPTADRGNEGGTPFIRLQPESGLRGLTVWYPEQNLLDPVPYPWSVQSLGPRCRVLDVTLGNPWRGVDFASYDSTGHIISYLSGGPLRVGVTVSKSAGDGWVEDVQFNPHYTVRLHASLPRPEYPGDADVGGAVIRFQRANLEGIVFGNCRREHVRGTFLYAAYDGISFRDDNGGTNARVFMHGSDTACRGAFIERTGSDGVDFINAQLVPLGQNVRAAIVTAPTFADTVRFFNTQVWAGPATAILDGPGTVLLRQLNTLSGPIRVNAGRLELHNANFAAELRPHLAVGRGVESVAGSAVMSRRGVLRVDSEAPDKTRLFAASAFVATALPTGDSPAEFSVDWDTPSPRTPDPALAGGGGSRSVSNWSCTTVDTAEGVAGAKALLLSGNADDPAYSFLYVRVIDGPLTLWPDSTLHYRVMPLNERGRCTGMDAVFVGGRTLRDSGIADTSGRGTHPGQTKGPVGEWTEVEIPLGALAGNTLEYLMVAYDSRGGGGEFRALFDDIRLTSAMAGANWRVGALPPGGIHAEAPAVTLRAEPDGAIRYTLDGSNPGPASPRYADPIRLAPGTVTEIRFAGESADGAVSPMVFSEVYDVPPR